MEEESESKPPSVTLPEDIIFHKILIKLPIKPLLRFKCVSKLWESTISSPQFAKSHLKNTSSPYQFLLSSGYLPCERQFASVTFDDHGRLQEVVNLKPPNYNGEAINVVGSCHGLVCFHDRHFNIHIWNPVTGNDSMISAPNKHAYQPVSLGFVYLSSVDDYKIACFLAAKPLPNMSAKIYLRSIYVFSFRSNKWEELTNLDIDDIHIDSANAAVLINETLYWSAMDAGDDNNDTDAVIIGVNLVNGQLSQIPFVSTAASRGSQPCAVKLFKMKGQLSLCYESYDHLHGYDAQAQVWMLERDGVSWMLLYNLTLGELQLLSITDDGKCLVHKPISIVGTTIEHRKLMLVDPSQLFLKQFQAAVEFCGPCNEAWNYNMTLVFPNY